MSILNTYTYSISGTQLLVHVYKDCDGSTKAYYDFSPSGKELCIGDNNIVWNGENIVVTYNPDQTITVRQGSNIVPLVVNMYQNQVPDCNIFDKYEKAQCPIHISSSQYNIYRYNIPLYLIVILVLLSIYIVYIIYLTI